MGYLTMISAQRSFITANN